MADIGLLLLASQDDHLVIVPERHLDTRTAQAMADAIDVARSFGDEGVVSRLDSIVSVDREAFAILQGIYDRPAAHPARDLAGRGWLSLPTNNGQLLIDIAGHRICEAPPTTDPLFVPTEGWEHYEELEIGTSSVTARTERGHWTRTIIQLDQR
jgi:hypothetical protein